MMTLALLGLLAGCGSAPPTLHYYSWMPTCAVECRHGAAAAPDWCCAVVLSGQLDRMSLVYQLEGKGCTLPSTIAGQVPSMPS